MKHAVSSLALPGIYKSGELISSLGGRKPSIWPVSERVTARLQGFLFSLLLVFNKCHACMFAYRVSPGEKDQLDL